MNIEINPALLEGSGVRSSWLSRSGDTSYQAVPLEGSADDLLMARVRDGDRDAFRQLVTRHIDRIVGLAHRVVGPAEAEDIAQDVFLKVWERREQWRTGEVAFRPWLYRVALNRCIDHTRRRKAVALDEAPEVADDGPDPLENRVAAEEAGRLREAMALLPDRQKIAITLYYNEDMTAGEVAEVMDLRLNAVESLLKRERQKLRALLG